MATLNKLMVTGVRNFNPEDGPHIVKFSTPLTLILGQNGCGKTTIIECLKYACSGELPGGSTRGQGFLYDPHLNGYMDTIGQVRLKIISEKGDLYTVFKSMSVTIRNKNLTFKKLDNTLKVKKNGEPEEQMVSGRCVDVDNFFPEAMGVSKSIINNVIFCHQEESLWPLDEASKLKKKFDEIFDVTKYHKCGDSVRKLIKSKTEKVKYMEVELLNLNDRKNEAERKRSSLTEKVQKNETYANEINEKEKKLQPIIIRLKEISELQKEITHLHEKKSAKDAERKIIDQQIKKLLNDLKGKAFNGTEAELEKEIENFGSKRGEIELKLKELKDKSIEVEDQENIATQKKSKLLAELGKLQQEKKSNSEKITKRNELYEKIEQLLKINVKYGEEIDVENAKNLIENAIELSRKTLKELTDQINKNEKKLQEKIDECRDTFNKVKHDIDSKRSQVAENNRKCRGINSQLQELNFSDDQLKSISNKIASIDLDLQSAKETFDSQNVNQTGIDKGKNLIKNLEETLEQLEEEMKLLTKNMITESEIERLQFDIKKRKNEVSKLKSKQFENFEVLFGSDVPQSNLKIAIETMKIENSRKVTDISRKITQQQNALTHKEARLKFSQEKLQSLEQQLKTDTKKVSDVCKDQSYERAKTFVTVATEKLRKEKGQYSSAKVLYEKFIEEFENEKACPLCKTEFGSKEQILKEIVADLRQQIKEIPKKLKKVEDDLKQKETELNKITELAPVNNKLKELSEQQIPTILFEIDVNTNECQQLKKELETLRSELERPEKIEAICNEVLPDATLIDQNNLEINNLSANIENLKLQIIPVQSNRSKKDTEAEIENVKLELANSRRQYETDIKKMQQYHNRCQELREMKNKLVQKQLQIQESTQGKIQLEKQLADLRSKTENLEQEIKELEESLPVLHNQLKDAEEQKDKAKINDKKILKETQDKLYQVERLFDEIEKYTSEINEYINQNRGDLFEKTLEFSIKLDELLKDLSITKSQINDEMNYMNNSLSSLELEFRNLTDNRELMEKRKRNTTLDEEIKGLSLKIGNCNETNLLSEKLKLEREYTKINQDINTFKGKKNELEEAIRELAEELEKPALKLANLNHKEKIYDIKILKRAVEDLKVFLGALEDSIIRFHQDKMVEINKLIRDYWRKIYKGNDIDYIEIKTETDTSSSAKRRSYNYKVVQVKNDTEIDVRGRCSAGQKVLASIIIRLSLAEIFGHKCGILALDEPTTNLDKDNIFSLCHSLAEIVNEKAKEKNFQLLIITHDEEFLNSLSRSIDKVDFINRVKRNDKGNSVVRVEKCGFN